MKKIMLLQNPGSLLSQEIGHLLTSQGYNVQAPPAESAINWVTEVQADQPDLILMELSSVAECETHYRFCQQLRQSSDTEHIPILLLDGHPVELNGGKTDQSVRTLVQGLRMGASDFIRSPYHMDEVIGKIQTALRLKTSLERAKVLTRQLNEVNEQLYQRNIQVEKELYIARQLQQSLLPAPLPFPDNSAEGAAMFTRLHYQDEKLRITGIYLPCDALGGDLYDVLKFKDNRLGVSITDVSGHGVPAGFITAIFKTSLYRITHETDDPAEVLYRLNNELFDIVKTGDYVTSLYLHIDLDTLSVVCSGAGHPYPYFYNAQDKNISRLKENGTPLVWAKDIPYPKDNLQLEPGSKIFLFTDGVSELKNPNGDLYGEDLLEQTLRRGIETDAPYLLDNVIESLSDFTEGAPLADDITMVLIEAL